MPLKIVFFGFFDFSAIVLLKHYKQTIFLKPRHTAPNDASYGPVRAGLRFNAILGQKETLLYFYNRALSIGLVKVGHDAVVKENV